MSHIKVTDDIISLLREIQRDAVLMWDESQTIDQAVDEIERLQKLISELASMIMPFALLMTSEEQEKVMKAVRGNRV